MAAKKISELQELDSLTGNETLPIVKEGKNYKVKLRIFEKRFIENLTKADVGLDKVDNTSDIDKPVSKATQRALMNKAPRDHRHNVDEIDGLDELVVEKVTESIEGLNIGSGTDEDETVGFANSEW